MGFRPYLFIKRSLTNDTMLKQECIPVGCVPPAAVAVCWGGLPQCVLGSPLRVWAWRPPRLDPSTSPPGCEPGDLQDMLGYHLQCMLEYPSPLLWTEFLTSFENITLPQTLFAGGNNLSVRVRSRCAQMDLYSASYRNNANARL